MGGEGRGLGRPPLLLGRRGEVYGAEVCANYRAPKTIDQRGEDGHQYTISLDSASEVDGNRSDSMSPGQRFAIAIHEVGGRITSRNSTVTVRWTPAYQGAGSDGG